MKRIHYELNVGTDENPSFVPASITYSEDNLEIAKKEAYNGEYTVEDEVEE